MSMDTRFKPNYFITAKTFTHLALSFFVFRIGLYCLCKYENLYTFESKLIFIVGRQFYMSI